MESQKDALSITKQSVGIITAVLHTAILSANPSVSMEYVIKEYNVQEDIQQESVINGGMEDVI